MRTRYIVESCPFPFHHSKLTRFETLEQAKMEAARIAERRIDIVTIHRVKSVNRKTGEIVTVEIG